MSYGQHLRKSRCGVYYFRYALPRDVQPSAGQAEISLSLRTRCKRDAELMRLALCFKFTQLIADTRRNLANHISDTTLSNAIRELMRKRKEENLFQAIADADLETAREREMRLDLQARLAEVERERTDLARRLVATLSSTATPTLPTEPSSSETLRHAHDPVSPAPSLKQPSLSEAISAFHTERVAVGKWTEKTAEAALSKLQLLVQWFDDVEVSKLNRDAMTGFFSAIKRLPRNASKLTALKNRSMRELTSLSGYEFISEKTVNLHMQSICAFFEWLNTDQVRWGLRGNIAKGLRIAKPEITKRQPFDGSDLQALFTTVEWKAKTFLHSYAYWLPLLGMYTGARINELCQLRLDDFKEIDGAHFVSLCEEGTRSKTAASARTIPIHSELIRLGLLRHVANLRSTGAIALFPECVGKRDGHGQDASRWFGKFKLRAGITDERKVFHSFRHTVQTQLLDKGIDEKSLVAPLAGHAGTGQGSKSYWNKKDVMRLIPVVEKIHYPTVTNLIPIVEQVRFGVDVHAANRRPPARRRTTTVNRKMPAERRTVT